MGHLIHRQIIELKFASKAAAQRWSPQLSELNQQIILPELERVFSELVAAGENLRIEQLELDLGRFSPGSFEAELVDLLREKLSEALQPYLSRVEKLADSANPKNHSEQPERPDPLALSGESLFELFEGFLQHGTLPWWIDKQQSAQLNSLYRNFWQQAPQQARQSVQKTLIGPLQRRRFIEQFSNQTHQFTMQQLLPESLAPLVIELRKLAAILLFRQQGQAQARTWSFEVVYQLIGKLKNQQAAQQTQLTRQLFEELASWSGLSYAQLTGAIDREVAGRNISVDTRIQLATLLRDDIGLADPRGMPVPLRQALLNDGTDQDDVEQKTDKLTVDTEVALENSGLVLLWPYLAELLRKLKLLEQRADGSVQPHPHALLLLQQLATGRPAEQEHRLALNKLLCGFPQSFPAPRRLRRSDVWDAEVTAMLNAVIGHWSALKNTSIAGFRHSFLQREGILRETEAGWSLQIERKAHDILLEQLPWGIGMIQFSWMRRPLQVEW